MVRRVVPPLDERAPELRVRVVESAERNAGGFPNGVIVVSVGLLAALANEAESAALLGHEIAHVVFRHNLVSHHYGDLTSSTVDRQKLSRRHEWEADSYSIDRIVAAGYDPVALSIMLGRLDPDPRPAYTRVAAWESHPDLRARIDAARKKVSKIEQPSVAPNRYDDAISGILLLAAQLEIEAAEFNAPVQRSIVISPGYRVAVAPTT